MSARAWRATSMSSDASAASTSAVDRPAIVIDGRNSSVSDWTRGGSAERLTASELRPRGSSRPPWGLRPKNRGKTRVSTGRVEKKLLYEVSQSDERTFTEQGHYSISNDSVEWPHDKYCVRSKTAPGSIVSRPHYDWAFVNILASPRTRSCRRPDAWGVGDPHRLRSGRCRR